MIQLVTDININNIDNQSLSIPWSKSIFVEYSALTPNSNLK